MKAIPIAFLCLCVGIPLAPAAGNPDAAAPAATPAPSSAPVPVSISRVVSVYVVAGAAGTDSKKREAERVWAEDVAVPQSAASWMVTEFTVTGKDSHFSFDTELSYRVVKREELSGGILLYSVELPSWSAAPREMKRYTLTFPGSALGAAQPLPFAMALACTRSSIKKGHAVVEEFSWDEASRKFKAVVAVGN